MTAALWREHGGDLLVIGAASLVLMLTEGAGLLLLVPVLQLVGVSLGDGASDRIAHAMDAALRAIGVTPNLVGVLAAVVAVIAVRAALQLVLAWWQARLEAEVIGRLRQRLFGAVVALPWARFVGERPAALLHAMGPQVDDVHGALMMALQVVSLVAAVLAAVAVAAVTSPLLTAVVALAGAVLFAVARALRAPGRAEGTHLLASSEGLFARLSELLGGMKMIHAHGAAARANCDVGADTEAWGRLMRRYAWRRALVSFVLVVLGAAMLAAVTWASVEVGHLAPATLLLLLLVYARIVPRLSEVQALWSALATTSASFVSVSALLARCEAARAAQDATDVGEPADAADTADVADAGDDAGLASSNPPAIEVREITVRYLGSATPALTRFSATFPAGSMTVVTGPSGAGKTTLADVLLRLLDPEQGTLCIDGRPADAASRAQWRSRVGYLAQEPMLFHGSIRENLTFARPGASDAQLWNVLRSAACDFVEGLPQGLDAAVGDRGVMLSGGERQRLALARALLREPALLVLDEATSALDADTEQRILHTVRALTGRCTVVFCSHRDAPKAVADHVVALQAAG